VGSLSRIPACIFPANSGSILYNLEEFSTFSFLRPAAEILVAKFVPSFLSGLFSPSDFFFSSMFLVLPVIAAISALEKRLPKVRAAKTLKEQIVLSLPLRIQLLGYLPSCLLLLEEGFSSGVASLIKIAMTFGLPAFVFWFLRSKFYEMETPEFAHLFSAWYQNLNTIKEEAY